MPQVVMALYQVRLTQVAIFLCSSPTCAPPPPTYCFDTEILTKEILGGLRFFLTCPKHLLTEARMLL